jgi:hypothetical protein
MIVRTVRKERCNSNAHLKTADKRIRDVIFEQMSPLVVYTRPTPHVFAFALGFALVKNTRTNSPHDDAEDEEANREYGVIRCDLFCSPMSSS